MSGRLVLGVDPGFASFGYCVMQLLPNAEVVHEVNVIRTSKDNKKLKTLSSDDNFRRTRAIYAMLADVISRHPVSVIAAEAMSWPRNSGSAGKMCMSWGVLGSLCEQLQLPLVQARPQAIKKAFGDAQVTKEAVMEALLKRYPGQFSVFTSSVPKGEWEHGFDAAGAIVACLDSDVIRMARGL